MGDPRITYTPNLHLSKLPANFHVWAQIMNDNLTTIDAYVNGFIQFSNFRGTWQNSTHYAIGDTVVDPDTALLWTAQVDHTSASIPDTFSQDHAEHPTYWFAAHSPATNRGLWTGPGTVYNVNDFVLVNGQKYAMCLVQHVSSASFEADAALGYWTILFDVTNLTSTVHVSDSQPPLLLTSMLWWNSTLGQLFLYYNDGNTTQFVPAAPAASATVVPAVNGTPVAAPAGASSTTVPLQYDYAANKLWAYYGGVWRSSPVFV